MLAPLLVSSVERGFKVRELSADKAYLSNDNLTAVEAVGAVPYIPLKANSRPTGKSDAWRRLYHTFEARNDEFRVAKLLDVSIYDVLNGTALPPGVCKHCGMPSDG